MNLFARLRALHAAVKRPMGDRFAATLRRAHPLVRLANEEAANAGERGEPFNAKEHRRRARNKAKRMRREARK